MRNMPLRRRRLRRQEGGVSERQTERPISLHAACVVVGWCLKDSGACASHVTLYTDGAYNKYYAIPLFSLRPLAPTLLTGNKAACFWGIVLSALLASSLSRPLCVCVCTPYRPLATWDVIQWVTVALHTLSSFFNTNTKYDDGLASFCLTIV